MKLTPHQEQAILYLWREHQRTGELWFDARCREISLPTVNALKVLGLVETRSELVTLQETSRGHMVIGRRYRTFCQVEVRLTEKILHLLREKRW